MIDVKSQIGFFTARLYRFEINYKFIFNISWISYAHLLRLYMYINFTNSLELTVSCQRFVTRKTDEV
jgi:hypothetical protein